MYITPYVRPPANIHQNSHRTLPVLCPSIFHRTLNKLSLSESGCKGRNNFTTPQNILGEKFSYFFAQKCNELFYNTISKLLISPLILSLQGNDRKECEPPQFYCHPHQLIHYSTHRSVHHIYIHGSLLSGKYGRFFHL